MGLVTTPEGVQIHLNPDNIAVVTDDPQMGLADLYGATHAGLRVNEPPAALLNRLGIIDDFAELTRPGGPPVWINGKAVTSVRAPLPGEYPANVNAVVFTAAMTQAVQESLATTITALNDCGGNL